MVKDMIREKTTQTTTCLVFKTQGSTKQDLLKGIKKIGGGELMIESSIQENGIGESKLNFPITLITLLENLIIVKNIYGNF